MGWFSRRTSDPDPGLPMFDDPSQATRFVRLAREVFAEHGYECIYASGQLRGADGWSYGLTNVALMACQCPEREWAEMLRRHVHGLDAAHATPRERNPEAVADRLYLRLWACSELPRKPDVREPFAEGLVGLASIDHPEHVETLTGTDDIGLLGGWAAVRRTALANLSRLTSDEVVTLGEDEEEVRLSVGGFFNASRVLTMPHLLRSDFLVEEPEFGVLFVVPNRHLVGIHRVRGPGMVSASASLLRVAQREYDMPGTISRDLWFWRRGEVQKVTHPGEGGVAEMRVDGLLEETMRELGLIEDMG